MSQMKMSHFCSRECRNTDEEISTLYVTCIPPEVTENAFRNLFSSFGKVLLVKILTPKLPQKGKPGFVVYETAETAEAAIQKLHGVKLGEYSLNVVKAKPRKPKLNKESPDYLSLIQKLEKGPLLAKDFDYFTKKLKAENFQNPLLSDSEGDLKEILNNTFQSNTASVTICAPDKTQEINHSTTKSNCCVVCGQVTKSVCSSCSSVFYCGRSCQVKDWPQHKGICKHPHHTESQQNTGKNDDNRLIVVDNVPVHQIAEKLKPSLEQNHHLSDSTKIPLIKPFVSELSVGDTLQLSVTDIDATNATLTCQSVLPKDVEKLKELQISLNKFYCLEKPLPILNFPKVGTFCAAVYSGDGQWYRAVVENIFLENQVQVKFIDYGNTELIDSKYICVLHDIFCAQKAFSVNCKLAGISKLHPLSEKAVDYIAQALQSSNLITNAHVSDVVGDVVYTKNVVNGDELSESLLKLGFAEGEIKNLNISQLDIEANNGTLQGKERCMPADTKNAKLNWSSAEKSEDLVPISIPDKTFQVIVSQVYSPNSIFCQVIQSGLVSLQNQFKDLTKYCESAKPSNWLPQVGQSCAAKFSEDGVWYRAQVTEMLQDSFVKVQFVDFGNFETVPANQIQELPSEFHSLPVQAFEASLSNTYVKAHKCTKECIIYLKRMQNHTFKAQLDGTCADTGKPSITMWTEDNKSVNEHLANMILQDKSSSDDELSKLPPFDICQTIAQNKPEVNTLVQVTITECNQPGEFYCQLVTEQLVQLTELLMKLTDHCNNTPIFKMDLIPGKFCSALFGDGQWYRAQIKQVDSDKVFVEYVDYGNTAFISKHDIRLLPAEFGNLSTQAFKCVLLDARPVEDTWNEEFINLTKSLIGKNLQAKCFCHDAIFAAKIPDLTNLLIVEKCALYSLEN